MKLSEIHLKEEPDLSEEAKQFLKDIEVTTYTINNGKIDVTGNVRLRNKDMRNVPIKFGKVNGHFWIDHCDVDDLKWLPDDVESYLTVEYLDVNSIEGLPQRVGDQVSIKFMKNLKNFKGLPKHCGEIYIRDCHQVEDLQGMPDVVTGKFSISMCHSLRSLKGAKNMKVGSNFQVRECFLQTLEGCPQTINGSFDVFDNALTSLKGGPTAVAGDYTCDHNKLTTLEGAPEKVPGRFDVAKNQLTNLKYAPKECKHLKANFNKITTLKNVHKDLANCKFEHLELRDNPFKEAMLGLILVNADHININYVQVTMPHQVITVLKKYFGKGKQGVLDAQREIEDLEDGKYEAYADL